MELRRLYGGSLGFVPPVVYANFVTSLDGVVSLGDVPSAGSVISAHNPADRVLMAMLRGLADAVLIGAGTLRATPGHKWTGEHVAPDLAGQISAMRAALGKTPAPRLVVLCASGEFDRNHPGLRSGATILTTDETAGALGSELPEGVAAVALGPGPRIDIARAVAWIHAQGLGSVLSEAGPTVLGQLLDAGLVNDVFLTVSPLVAGRSREAVRKGLVDGIEFLPDRRLGLGLVGVRRHGDYLFLRYSA